MNTLEFSPSMRMSPGRFPNQAKRPGANRRRAPIASTPAPTIIRTLPNRTLRGYRQRESFPPPLGCLTLDHMTDARRSTQLRPETRTSDGDSDESAHIVMREDQMRGYITGEPIQALCGKVWVPSRDYQDLPICQPCSDERDRLLAGMKGLN